MSNGPRVTIGSTRMLSPSSSTRASSAANCSGAPSVRPAASPTVQALMVSLRFCSAGKRCNGGLGPDLAATLVSPAAFAACWAGARSTASKASTPATTSAKRLELISIPDSRLNRIFACPRAMPRATYLLADREAFILLRQREQPRRCPIAKDECRRSPCPAAPSA